MKHSIITCLAITLPFVGYSQKEFKLMKKSINKQILLLLMVLTFNCQSQTIINSNILGTETNFGSNIYKPDGIYFNAYTDGSIANGVYYIDDNESISLIKEGVRIQFEHQNRLILKNTSDHKLYNMDLNTNIASLFFSNSNIFLISQRIIEHNDLYYFVGYDISQSHYAMMSLDFNGVLSTISVFNGPVQNTNRLHEDSGLLYFFTNTLTPSAQHFYSFDPNTGNINTITSQEYNNHPYPYFNDALTSISAGGIDYTINGNTQLALNTNNLDLTCFDIIGGEGPPILEILGNINDKVYLLLNYNLGSTNGLYRWPEDDGNGLCQTVSVTSTDALSQSIVFPNPTNDYFIIKSPKHYILGYELRNSLGVLIKEEITEGGINELIVPVTLLASSIYILRVHYPSGQNETFKILVQH